MPPRGVKSSKRERQYEHIKDSARKRGASTKRAKEIAARTVNKERRDAGETKTSRPKTSAARGRSSTSRTTGARKKSTAKRATKKR